MRLGIFAKTFPGAEPGPVLERVRDAGFAVAHYNMACSGLSSMPDAIPEGVADAVAAAAKAAGIEVPSVSATYNMIHPDPEARERGHRSLAVIAASAPRMGARLLTLCTGTRDPDDQWRAHPGNGTPQAWRELLAGLERAIALADRHDLELGIEPELANVVDSAPAARRLLKDLASPRLKIVLDPANLFEVERAPRRQYLVAQAVDLLGERLAMAHAKDRAEDGGFVAPGRGVIDFVDFARRLRDAGFDGPLVTHGLAAKEAPEVARFLTDALAAAG